MTTLKLNIKVRPTFQSRVAGLPVTPSRKATPGGGGADRFIPNRYVIGFRGNHMLNCSTHSYCRM